MAVLSARYDVFGLEIQTLKEAESGHKCFSFYQFDLYVWADKHAGIAGFGFVLLLSG